VTSVPGSISTPGGAASARSHKRFIPSSDDLLRLDRPLHCLVVEDEAINMRIMCRMLGRVGCTFDAVCDGHEVDIDDILERQRGSSGRKPYDVVLTDVVMPRTSGDELCRKLRSAGCNLPIVACTSNVDAADLDHYVACGFQHVLPKPFSAGELRAVLTMVNALPPSSIAAGAPPPRRPVPKSLSLSPPRASSARSPPRGSSARQ